MQARHSTTAIATAFTLFLMTSGTFAAPPAPADLPTPRPDALAHCPDAMAQIQELLATATRAIGDDGEVHARFVVDAAGHVGDITVDGHRRYALRTRLALESLACQGGIPQAYRLTIRFAPDGPGRRDAPGPLAVLERAP